MQLLYKVLLTFTLFIIVFGVIYRESLKTILLNLLVVMRGILAPNCTWYGVSDLLLKDGAGVNLYNTYKQKYGDFVPSNMFGTTVYLVTNNNYIKIILDNSPNLFNVGRLKKTFFRSFMAKNVGVSSGCPWKKRRRVNEMALVTDRLHTYAKKYNADMSEQLTKWQGRSEVGYEDFFNLGKKMVAKIVFNADSVGNSVFKIFSEANSIAVFYNPDFKISPKIYNGYIKVLSHYIDNPNKDSLVELCLEATHDKEEVLHQIPHFIFPIVGLFVATIPRLLLLLCNHEKVFKKVVREIHSVYSYDMNNYTAIYRLGFLRKCILETLRLNNPVITTFRTLDKDYTFDHKYSFKKGTQFLILNNPVLREKEFFDQPNKFIPSRWTPEMEKSYYAISFNQGPQRCPGKELAIYLVQSFVYNLIKIKNIGKGGTITSDEINTTSISQVLNPCNIRFRFA